MRGLYTELYEYTGEWITDLILKCRSANLSLAEEWISKKSALDFYRDTEWYIYDLTHYQQDILGESWYTWYVYILNKIRKPDRLLRGLDLGGGIGEYTIEAAKNYCLMDYIDVDGKTKDYAKWRFARNGIRVNIYDETFKITDHYDFVVAMDIFEHLKNPEERIKEIAEHTEYLFANPEQVKYNEKYPMHVSNYDLTPYFDQVNGNLWIARKGVMQGA